MTEKDLETLRLRDNLIKMPSMVQWEDINVGSMYRIPKLGEGCLNRKDIEIISKNDTEATYRIVSGKAAKNERTMHRTSVIAKILVDLKAF